LSRVIGYRPHVSGGNAIAGKVAANGKTCHIPHRQPMRKTLRVLPGAICDATESLLYLWDLLAKTSLQAMMCPKKTARRIVRAVNSKIWQ
jgi:hypothetical protein